MLPVSGFLSFNAQCQLFTNADKILLAVSGGKDSVLMAYLFHAAGIDFGIAHCNFGLRGKESDADEEFTEELARQFDTPFFSVRFNTSEYAALNQVSVQMAARELRYGWFEEIRSNFGYDYISVAHHQNDSAETVILNLVRGTGIAGLHGILPKRGRLLRPLLFLDRNEIDRLISSENIPYREDSSNTSVKYARNKIRHEVIPRLKELNPNLEQTFELNGRRFAELEEFLNQQADLLRSSLFKLQPGNSFHIDLERIKALSPRSLLLYELFKPFGFSEDTLHDLALSWQGQAGKLFRSATHQLLLDRKKLILYPLSKETEQETLIYTADEKIFWKGYEFKQEAITGVSFNRHHDQRMAYLDADRLDYPLIVRSWRKGDTFFPLGMKGRKKLSDFFISLKIPVSEKKNIPILVNSTGKIIWVAGYRIDDHFKITGRTKKVAIFAIRE